MSFSKIYASWWRSSGSGDLSLGAAGLLARMHSYCADNNTGGIVHLSSLRRLSGGSNARSVKAALNELLESGCVIPDGDDGVCVDVIGFEDGW